VQIIPENRNVCPAGRIRDIYGRVDEYEMRRIKRCNIDYIWIVLKILVHNCHDLYLTFEEGTLNGFHQFYSDRNDTHTIYIS
jgi:hypothetical protein